MLVVNGHVVVRPTRAGSAGRGSLPTFHPTDMHPPPPLTRTSSLQGAVEHVLGTNLTSAEPMGKVVSRLMKARETMPDIRDLESGSSKRNLSVVGLASPEDVLVKEGQGAQIGAGEQEESTGVLRKRKCSIRLCFCMPAFLCLCVMGVALLVGLLIYMAAIDSSDKLGGRLVECIQSRLPLRLRSLANDLLATSAFHGISLVSTFHVVGPDPAEFDNFVAYMKDTMPWQYSWLGSYFLLNRNTGSANLMIQMKGLDDANERVTYDVLRRRSDLGPLIHEGLRLSFPKNDPFSSPSQATLAAQEFPYLGQLYEVQNLQIPYSDYQQGLIAKFINPYVLQESATQANLVLGVGGSVLSPPSCTTVLPPQLLEWTLIPHGCCLTVMASDSFVARSQEVKRMGR